jgi:hypothetical protein
MPPPEPASVFKRSGNRFASRKRVIKNLEPRFDSIETEKVLGGFAAASDFPAIDLGIALERDGVLFGFDRRAATGSRLDWPAARV